MDVLPKCLVVVGAHVAFAPPEPVAGVFVQRTEDDRHFAAVGAHRVVGGGGDGIKPVVQFALQVAADEALCFDFAGVKGAAARHRVFQVRGEGDGRAEGIGFYEGFGQRFAVFFRRFTVFGRLFVGIKAEDGRVFAAHGGDVGFAAVAVVGAVAARAFVNGVLLAKEGLFVRGEVFQLL